MAEPCITAEEPQCWRGFLPLCPRDLSSHRQQLGEYASSGPEPAGLAQQSAGPAPRRATSPRGSSVGPALVTSELLTRGKAVLQSPGSPAKRLATPVQG